MATAVKELEGARREVTFVSKYSGQILVVEAGELSNRQDRGKKGKRIRFRNGLYTTSDPFEIDFLEAEKLYPRPGCEIKFHSEQYTCLECGDVFPNKNQMNGHLSAHKRERKDK